MILTGNNNTPDDELYDDTNDITSGNSIETE